MDRSFIIVDVWKSLSVIKFSCCSSGFSDLGANCILLHVNLIQGIAVEMLQFFVSLSFCKNRKMFHLKCVFPALP
jgi:hypothetical protein